MNKENLTPVNRIILNSINFMKIEFNFNLKDIQKILLENQKCKVSKSRQKKLITQLYEL